MAPTQILAEQHALNLRGWLEPLGVRVDLFTGNTKAKGKKGDRLQGGEIDLFNAKPAPKSAGSVVVGTHALLYDSYAADKLGLIVIDEQHKFGVLQRLGTKPQRAESRHSRDDGDADSAHAWHDGLRRSRCLDPR